MRIHRLLLLVSFILLACLAQAQTTGALFITSPANGTAVDRSVVQIQFELMSGVSAAGIPTFRLQLDKQSPVVTSDTEYFLYSVSPGWHTITIALVDANGTRIFGAQNQVEFEVRRDDGELAREAGSL